MSKEVELSNWHTTVLRLKTLADYLSQDSNQNAAFLAFWVKAAIGHILPIFNPVILNF